MSSKPTPGPCVVLAPSLPKQSVAAWICTVGNNHNDPAVFSTAVGPDGKFIFGDKLADASLIAEAFNVHHETGLTPQQLREQRDELIALIKRIETNPVTRVLMQHRTDMRAAIAKVEGRS